MRFHKITVSVAIVILILSAALSSAGVPPKINIQGQLTDDQGIPLPDKSYDIQFRIYDHPTAGNVLWSSDGYQPVTVVNGRFDYFIGSSYPLPDSLHDFDSLWVAMKMSGESEMLPRIPIVSVVYAVQAKFADTADVAVISLAGGGGGWVDEGTVVRLANDTDSVGIGTSTPEYKLDVQHAGSAIRGQTLGSGWNAGLFGRSESGGIGVLASSVSGRAMHAVSGSGYAGYFDGPKNYFSGNVGIGVSTTDEMLHMETAASGVRAFLQIETSHATNWGEAGIRLKTPDNIWHFRMDDDSHNNLPVEGSLSLRSQDLNKEVMTWTNDGKVGIGTVDPDATVAVIGDMNVTGNVNLASDLNVEGAYRGNITSTSGSDGAPFPRPAYDSGWQEVGQDEKPLLTHNIGGDPDDYVVDMQFQNETGRRGIYGYGTFKTESLTGTLSRGAYWYELTNTSIRVHRVGDDISAAKIRIRIWVYK